MRFTLDERNVRYWSAADRRWVVDPGMFDLWVGSSSAAEAHAMFTVGGAPRPAR